MLIRLGFCTCKRCVWHPVKQHPSPQSSFTYFTYNCLKCFLFVSFCFVLLFIFLLHQFAILPKIRYLKIKFVILSGPFQISLICFWHECNTCKLCWPLYFCQWQLSYIFLWFAYWIFVSTFNMSNNVCCRKGTNLSLSLKLSFTLLKFIIWWFMLS